MNKKTFLIYLVFFLIGDIFFSNFVYKRDINHNCYEQLNDFFQLKKNCYAREKWIKNVQSYDVRTDENGFRFSGKKKDKSKIELNHYKSILPDGYYFCSGHKSNSQIID